MALLFHPPIVLQMTHSSSSSTITLSPMFPHSSLSMKASSLRKNPPTVNKCNNIIICMAHPKRVKMVAKQIRRELSDMLLTDKVLQVAVFPEAALGADRYLSSLTTISDVEISGDLQVVKVYVSVFGDERGKEIAIAGLKSKAKYIRSALGRRMKLRLTPEIRFIEDDSIERGSRVIAILDKLKNESQNAHVHDEISDLDTPEQDEGSTPSKSASVFQDKDWQEDEDDDVFYIDKRIGGLQP